jgi:hypothetical protein
LVAIANINRKPQRLTDNGNAIAHIIHLRSVIEGIDRNHEGIGCRFNRLRTTPIANYDLCLRLSENAAVQHLKMPLYFYRTHPHSISGRQYQQQIECSQTAIAQALQRRGLSDRYQIEVQADNRFVLKKK